MRILFIGGPLDGQLKDINETISPLVPANINATLPNGIIVQYHVDFFSGAKLQFPMAVFEELGPDEVFQMLLHWYSVKPRVKPIAPPTAAGNVPPPTEPPPKLPESPESLEPPESPEPPTQLPSGGGNIIVP